MSAQVTLVTIIITTPPNHHRYHHHHHHYHRRHHNDFSLHSSSHRWLSPCSHRQCSSTLAAARDQGLPFFLWKIIINIIIHIHRHHHRHHHHHDFPRHHQASKKFFSVPHAVPSLNNELLSRVVFARMKVKDFSFCESLKMTIHGHTDDNNQPR